MKPLFNIRPNEKNWIKEVDYKLFQLGKAYGKWSRTREIAIRWASIQNTLDFRIKNPHTLLFNGGHGFLATYDQSPNDYADESRILDFLNFRDPYSAVYRDFPGKIQWVDTGIEADLHQRVDFWIHQENRVLDRSIAKKTKNFFFEPSMTSNEILKGLDYGSNLISNLQAKGCNTVILGGLGKGADFSNLVFYCAQSQVSLNKLTFLSREEIAKVKRALQKHPLSRDVFTQINYFAGFELVVLLGALLQAADFGMTIILEGRTAATALYIARHWYEVIDQKVFVIETPSDPLEQYLLNQINTSTLGMGVSEAFPGLSGPQALHTLQTLSRLFK